MDLKKRWTALFYRHLGHHGPKEGPPLPPEPLRRTQTALILKILTILEILIQTPHKIRLTSIRWIRYHMPNCNQRCKGEKVMPELIAVPIGFAGTAIRVPLDVLKEAEAAETHNVRGIAYSEAGEHGLALNAFKQAIELRPDYVNAYYNLGLNAINCGCHDMAIAALSQAIALEPTFAEAYVNRGIACEKNGEVDAVLERYHITVGLHPAPSGCGETAYQTAIAAAIEDYNTAIMLNPKLAAAYVNRGTACCKKGEVDASLAAYSTAITLKPDCTAGYVNRGILYDRKGENEPAIADYHRAIALAPDEPVAYNHRGAAYLHKGDTERAIQDANTAITLDSEYAEAYYSRGVTWLHLREWEKARADLIAAKFKVLNIIAAFRDSYKSVGHFERKTGVKLPEDIAAMLMPKKEPGEHEKETRRMLALKYYKTHELSIGLAARLACMPYNEFLVFMGNYRLSPFGETPGELAAECANV